MLRIAVATLAAAAAGLLGAPGQAAAQAYDVCAVPECHEPTPPDAGDCEAGFLGIGTDRTCLAQQDALFAQARKEHSACEAKRRADLAACAALRVRAHFDGVTAALADGAGCRAGHECASGYCLPGPAARPAVATSAQPEGPAWFCTAASMDCARPGTAGVPLGASLNQGGARLECRATGPTSWPQLLPPE